MTWVRPYKNARTPLHATYQVDEQGCWIWQLATTPDGYGHVGRSDYRGRAHHWMWLQLRGPIPAGLQVDHLCRRPVCVNPDHMELVTGAENRRRSDSPVGVNFRKTHCVNGHPFDEANTHRLTTRGTPMRRCRACMNVRQKARYDADPEKYRERSRAYKRAKRLKAVEAGE